MTSAASPDRERIVRPKRPRHLSEAMRCETAFRLIVSECLEEVATNHEALSSGDPVALHPDPHRPDAAEGGGRFLRPDGGGQRMDTAEIRAEMVERPSRRNTRPRCCDRQQQGLARGAHADGGTQRCVRRPQGDAAERSLLAMVRRHVGLGRQRPVDHAAEIAAPRSGGPCRSRCFTRAGWRGGTEAVFRRAAGCKAWGRASAIASGSPASGCATPSSSRRRPAGRPLRVVAQRPQASAQGTAAARRTERRRGPPRAARQCRCLLRNAPRSARPRHQRVHERKRKSRLLRQAAAVYRKIAEMTAIVSRPCQRSQACQPSIAPALIVVFIPFPVVIAMPDGSSTAHLYRPKLVTTLDWKAMALEHVPPRRAVGADGRGGGAAAIDGDRGGLGRGRRSAGCYTAIVGGFLVSALGGSRFQIGGPAGAFIVLGRRHRRAASASRACCSPCWCRG